jgi:membrane associated rhomboid family serine protease
MIPVRDVIPSRTYPGATVALLVAHAASLASADVRRWWFPWCVNMIVLWLFGSTVEDRIGHGRFVTFYLFCAAVAAAASAAVAAILLAPVAAGGAVAGVSAAYFLMFPRSRVLTLVPVVAGVDVVDVPAWSVCGVWALVQGAAAGTVAAGEAGADALAMMVGLAAGALAGGLGWLVFRRPQRMRVDWWD